MILDMIQEESQAQCNKFFLDPPKKYNQTEEFYFPETSKIFQNYGNIKHFVHQINTTLNPNKMKLFQSRILKQKYGYLKCRFCSAFLTVKMEKDKLKVAKYSNIHSHSSNQFKKNQQLQIIQFIDQFQGYRNNLMNIIMNKFNISKRRYYYIFNKSQKSIQFTQLLSQLQKRGYDILMQRIQNQKYPQIFLYSTPAMAKLYYKFGDVVSFDITYNVVRERNSSNKQWGSAFFVGLDTNLRIIIFAVCLISNQSVNSMEKLFQGFFKLFNKQPAIIISDEQQSIISALKRLKQRKIFQGNHTFDVYHIMKNIRKKVTKEEFYIYQKLIKDRNCQRFESTLEMALNSNTSQQTLKVFINQKSQSCCYSQLPNIFIGPSSSSSRNQKLNDILKTFIPRQVHWTNFFNRVEKVISHLLNNCNKRTLEHKTYENLFKDHGLLQVRLKTQIKIFNYFISNYVRALKMNCQKLQQNVFVCYDFKEKWFVQEEICKCGVTQKLGVPCEHLLRVLFIQNKHNYFQFFNKRWILEQQIEQKQKRGRPRNSRRNMIP